jgi:hypothetical protein
MLYRDGTAPSGHTTNSRCSTALTNLKFRITTPEILKLGSDTRAFLLKERVSLRFAVRGSFSRC